MTTEQKARAYDKAIEKIKYVMEHGVSPVLNKEDLQDIFHELKESEDEKIRKALLEMVHDTTGDELWIDYNVHKEDALAWLEKQGEQKSVDNLTRQEAMDIAVAKCFEQGRQKPKWSEEDERMLKGIISDVKFEGYNNYMQANSYKKIEWLKELKQRIGQ